SPRARLAPLRSGVLSPEVRAVQRVRAAARSDHHVSAVAPAAKSLEQVPALSHGGSPPADRRGADRALQAVACDAGRRAGMDEGVDHGGGLLSPVRVPAPERARDRVLRRCAGGWRCAQAGVRIDRRRNTFGALGRLYVSSPGISKALAGHLLDPLSAL